MGIGQDVSTSIGNSNFPTLLWVYYLIATLLMFVTFFNMLVSVLNGTLSDVEAEGELSAFKEKIDMFSDFIFWLRDGITIKRYLYVITASEEEEDTSEQYVAQFCKAQDESDDKIKEVIYQNVAEDLGGDLKTQQIAIENGLRDIYS